MDNRGQPTCWRKGSRPCQYYTHARTGPWHMHRSVSCRRIAARCAHGDSGPNNTPLRLTCRWARTWEWLGCSPIRTSSPCSRRHRARPRGRAPDDPRRAASANARGRASQRGAAQWQLRRSALLDLVDVVPTAVAWLLVPLLFRHRCLSCWRKQRVTAPLQASWLVSSDNNPSVCLLSPSQAGVRVPGLPWSSTLAASPGRLHEWDRSLGCGAGLGGAEDFLRTSMDDL